MTDRPKVYPWIFVNPLPKRILWEMEPYQTQEIERWKRKLRWSDERLALFRKLVTEYRQELSIENYVRIRREFPDVGIKIDLFGAELLSWGWKGDLENQLKKYGLDRDLLEAGLHANESGIEELSLRLLECLVARSKLPKDGPGHIEKRRNAISDATVNYLIAIILEALEDDKKTCRIPASLVVLVREQLSGQIPDLYKASVSRNRRFKTAIVAAQIIYELKKKVTVRNLAKYAGISRSAADRWIRDPEFQREFEEWKKVQAEAYAAEQVSHQNVGAGHQKNQAFFLPMLAPVRARLLGLSRTLVARLLR